MAEIAFSPSRQGTAATFWFSGVGLQLGTCSESFIGKHVKGTSRCLPILIAGNPVNFGKLTKLTTAEAIAAALYIAGFKKEAEDLMSIFTWGHTFFELNGVLLDNYALARDSAEIVDMQNTLLKGKKHT